MPKKFWPLTMTEASYIAQLPWYAGTDKEIATKYKVEENLIKQIRSGHGYNGVNL